MRWCYRPAPGIASSRRVTISRWSGGYPLEQRYDALRPDADSHDLAAARAAQVPVPVSDPVGGTQGALVALWRRG